MNFNDIYSKAKKLKEASHLDEMAVLGKKDVLGWKDEDEVADLYMRNRDGDPDAHQDMKNFYLDFWSHEDNKERLHTGRKPANKVWTDALWNINKDVEKKRANGGEFKKASGLPVFGDVRVLEYSINEEDEQLRVMLYIPQKYGKKVYSFIDDKKVPGVIFRAFYKLTGMDYENGSDDNIDSSSDNFIDYDFLSEDEDTVLDREWGDGGSSYRAGNVTTLFGDDDDIYDEVMDRVWTAAAGLKFGSIKELMDYCMSEEEIENL